MLQNGSAPSAAELFFTWVQLHPVVAFLLQAFVIGALALLALASLAGAFYWGLWLVRLLTAANRKRFIETPIPGLRRGKLAGQEFELVQQLAEEDANAVKGMLLALEALEQRVSGLEKSVEDTQDWISGLPLDRGESKYS